MDIRGTNSDNAFFFGLVCCFFAWNEHQLLVLFHYAYYPKNYLELFLLALHVAHRLLGNSATREEYPLSPKESKSVQRCSAGLLCSWLALRSVRCAEPRCCDSLSTKRVPQRYANALQSREVYHLLILLKPRTTNWRRMREGCCGAKPSPHNSHKVSRAVFLSSEGQKQVARD